MTDAMDFPPPSQFRDQPWEARYTQMGDRAETAFEEWCDSIPKGYVRWGLQRPNINLRKVPTRIRYAPDYLLHNCFVECQGLGRDQTLKVKIDKMNSLHWWNDLFPVFFFVWDSHNKRATMFPLRHLDDLLGEGCASLGIFSEGKPYFAFPAERVFDAEE